MNLNDYADEVAGVIGIAPGAPISREKLAYLALGIAGEAGEVADAVKKMLRDNHDDLTDAADELGDVIFYWSCLCVVCGRDPHEILDASAEKVRTKLGGRTIVD